MSGGACRASVAEAKGFFGWIGVLVVRRPWGVIGVWVALSAVLAVSFPSLTEMAAKRPVSVLPSDAPVLVTTRQVAESFHQSGSDYENVVMVVLSDENGLSPDDLITYRRLAEALRTDTRDIAVMQDFIRTPALQEAVTSKDHKAWYIPLVIAGAVGSPELHEGFGRVSDIIKRSVAGSTLTANLTGPAATDDDLVYIGIRDTHVIEIAVALMALTILLVIYRNPATALLPVATIGVSLGGAQAIVSGLAELGLGISSQTITLMTTMMAGAGIDYAVFIIGRYHDYLRLGMDSDEAVFTALTSIGKVIAGSAATVSITFLGMIFAHLGVFRNVGPALAISVAVAFLAAVTFLPAMMVLAGRRGLITPRADLTSRFWERSSVRIVRRPVVHLIASVGVLAILAGCAAFARYNYDDSKTLSSSIESSIGYETLARHFPLNATIPEYLVVHSTEDLRQPAFFYELKQMEQRVSQMPGITDLHGAPVLATSAERAESSSHDSWLESALGGHQKSHSSGDAVDSFPNVANLLSSIGSTATAGPDLGLPAIPGMPASSHPAAGVDDTAAFVSTVRALGFAMSVDVAELSSGVNAAPVTVLDVVSSTAHDGGALQKINDLAQRLSAFPDATNIEAASLKVHQLLDKTGKELRIMANESPAGTNPEDDLQPITRTSFDATEQLVDGVRDLISQTGHTGGGLAQALTAFISPDGHTARYSMESNLNPFGADAMSQIMHVVDTAKGSLKDSALKNASVSASGVTAMLRDTRSYYGHDIELIVVVTILIVFLILVAVLRAVVAPLYLVVSVVISYLSALGIGVVVFQFILGQDLTWNIPGLTFIVLVAMGADYNLLLISRLKEESADGVRTGVIRTVGSTGGVITAAGVIFAASMFGMLFASISTLVQAGFIIGTGLLLDTFLVRTITVPAIAVLLGNANWWPSKPPPPRDQAAILLGDNDIRPTDSVPLVGRETSL